MRQYLKFYAVIFSVVIAACISTKVHAADVFTPADQARIGKFREEPTSAGPIDPSGFWISGIAGMAWGDREISRTINRTLGLDIDGDTLQQVIPPTADTNEDEVISSEEAAAFLLSEANIPSTPTADGLSIPLVGDQTRVRGESEFDSPFFGAGASYLSRQPGSQIGWELSLEAIFYTDAESSLSHSGATGTFRSGTALSDGVIPGEGGGPFCTPGTNCAGDTSQFPQSGFVSIEREMDIDLVPSFMFFLGDQFSVSVGAGPSLAKASAKGHNSTDAIAAEGGRQLATTLDDDDWSLGWVAKLSADYFMSDRMRLTAFAAGKWHTFDFDGASSFREPFTGGAFTGSATDHVESDESLFLVGVKFSVKLGGAVR